MSEALMVCLLHVVKLMERLFLCLDDPSVFIFHFLKEQKKAVMLSFNLANAEVAM